MISKSGAWILNKKDFRKEHVYCDILSNKIADYIKILKIHKIYDFGCGAGDYVKKFRNSGIEAYGFDGNPSTFDILNCRVQDLTEDFSEPPVDFLMCLEVCEHVPKKYEDKLLQNINKHLNPGGTLLLSWAIIGQGGFGHVNCQNNDYVIKKIESMGYSFNKNDTEMFRQLDYINAYWFKNTIMVFNKLNSVD
jgi:SAM-dependent methyltransferase